jgi:type IX secretion system PorP/SprF family membrane protein
MGKLLLLAICTFALCVSSQAQIDPLYAQYISNPMLINPAYAGLNNNLNAGITYRKQWAGFDGSPATYNSVGARFTTHELSFGLNMAMFAFHRTSITNF